MADVPVLIAGGGPIGLALAADLGRRGIRTLLVEKRPDQLGSPKMIQVSVRTMEFCRQLGLTEAIRNWGFPHEHNMDSVFVTTMQGWELGRVKLDSIAARPFEPDSPERDIHCPQTWFDPILQGYARRQPCVTLRYGVELQAFEQDDRGVTAHLVDAETGVRETVRADYLVGADGFTSTIRDILDIPMDGEPFLDLSMSVYVRIPTMKQRHEHGEAYRYVFIGP
jgi:2-polyprenyl-6-methoxyphenol hydroxylase-like FAD-dependent oxidoreductase